MRSTWRVEPMFPGLLPIVATFFVPRSELLFLGTMLLVVGLAITGYREYKTIVGDESKGGA